MMPDPPNAVFVYGTLRRGECRAIFWPYSPVAVETAFVRGRLYDLGPYPALAPGEDWIRGELWRLNPAHTAETLEVLDEVEGYSVSPGDLYVRKVVECRTQSGDAYLASVYFYARPERLDERARVLPGKEGWCEYEKKLDTR
jgi:gamma-glutamylcyclotransferase (GGCT)/AIG2-like uncharacterized protein YtfP